jgi:uncharacterized membrane protein YesL
MQSLNERLLKNMSIFYNPQKSGRGISKEDASGKGKKPLHLFGEIFGRKFWQLMQLNFVFILLCLPIITIGPAIAALTHVMRKFIIEQPIFVFEEFFAAFKKHFKRTVILGIFSTIFSAAFAINLLIFYGNSLTDEPYPHATLLIAMNLVAGILFFVLNTYIYPQIVCLDLSMRSIIKNALVLSMAGFKRNVVTVLVFAGVLMFIILTLPASLIALPLAPFAQLAFLSVFNAYPAILRYIVNPYYEERGEKNPEIQDFTLGNKSRDENGERIEKPNIFTDLGGKEIPINKKSIKTSGKIIK